MRYQAQSNNLLKQVHQRTKWWAVGSFVSLFLLSNTFYHPVVKLSLHQCQPHIPVHSQDLASEEFQRRRQGKISSAFQQEHKRTSLMSCLGIHVCFLCLTCIQTRLFGNRTEQQAPTPDGVAERNVTGNMAARRKAQHEPRHLADERWRSWKISSNTDCSSRCDATRCESSTEDALRNEKESAAAVSWELWRK